MSETTSITPEMGLAAIRVLFPGQRLNDHIILKVGAALQAALAVAPQSAPLAVEQIDKAAQKLAELFDYPWEHMPEEGRRTMRANVVKVFEAALGN